MKVKNGLKQFARSIIPEFLQINILQERTKYLNQSYSQEGEDLILERLFSEKQSGFFVDIGAHHPRRFSNTYKFYCKGWKGINIDPLPGMKKAFDKERPLDINLELGISLTESMLTYFLFNEPALNTFNKEEALKKQKIEGYFLEHSIKLTTLPLSKILDTYLPPNTNIDFLSIDVEGLDLEVLKSNNWEKYTPTFLLVEELREDINTIISKSEIYSYLNGIGYHFFARTYNTSFYRRV